MKRYVRAMVNMNGIRWNIELWKRVMGHVKVCLQNVPVGLRDAVLCFLTVGDGKLKGAMDKCVVMC